ncbi:MAG: leucine-rich repeat domain-containing protein [Acutalibacteraceae bacterium]
MNNKKLVALLLAAMMSVSTASVAFAAPVVSNSPVVYGDTNNNLTDDIDEPAVENAMRAALGLEDGEVMTAEMAATIKTLTITGGDMLHGSLRGLEYCTGLESLTLENGKVEDLKYLKELSNLKELHLAGNNITDLSSIAGLTKLEVLDVPETPDWLTLLHWAAPPLR